MNTGEKQGNSLSAILFNLVLEYVIRMIKKTVGEQFVVVAETRIIVNKIIEEGEK